MQKTILMAMLILFLFGSYVEASTQSTNKNQSPYEKAILSLMFEVVF